MKTSSAHMKLHFSCISTRPDILMNMCRYFMSGSVCMIFYHPKWNFISVEMTDMKSITALNFKRACALNATSNESALIHSIQVSCGFEISFWSKWSIWNPYRFELHFTSIHVNTSKELTEHRSEIFNRNEIILCRFEFISPLMWTYSK